MRISYSISILLILLSLVACNAQNKKGQVTVQEFSEKLNTESNKLILDVRTPDEYNSGHIAGSVNIDYFNENFKTEVAKLDKSKTVFVYCRSGGRSAKSAAILNEMGFTNVIDLEGGIGAWSGAGNPVEK